MQYNHKDYLAQVGLKTLDFDPGPLDGKWGPKSADAYLDSLRAMGIGFGQEFEVNPPKPGEREEFFGPPGVKGGYTPPLVFFPPPYPMEFSWGGNVSRIGCHKRIATPLKWALTELVKSNGQDWIEDHGLHIYAGCYNPRKSRGGTGWSDHAFAAAIDLNPKENGNRTLWSPNDRGPSRPATMPMGAVTVFRKHGFQVGFATSEPETRRDMMHIAFVDRP